MWQGADVTEVIRVLEGAIYHVHAKDLVVDDHISRVNGVLDPSDFLQLSKNRSWNFRNVGFGQSEIFRRKFISTLRLVGYNDVLSIETEDPLTEPEESLALSASFLDKILLRKDPVPLWFQPSGQKANAERQ